MTTAQLNKVGRKTALLTFLFGTAIFGFYFITSEFEVLFLGYAFIAIAGLINIGIIISILLKVNNDDEERKKTLSTCRMMLLNIPVLVLYCWVALTLINIMRITFTNTTSQNLTNIKILGCEREHIDKLEAGESKTVWIDIIGDCTINIEYLTNGIRKEENVEEYVTNGMGQKITHKIGKPNKEKL